MGDSSCSARLQCIATAKRPCVVLLFPQLQGLIRVEAELIPSHFRRTKHGLQVQG